MMRLCLQLVQQNQTFLVPQNFEGMLFFPSPVHHILDAEY